MVNLLERALIADIAMEFSLPGALLKFRAIPIRVLQGALEQ